jgi:hypothetical protein
MTEASEAQRNAIDTGLVCTSAKLNSCLPMADISLVCQHKNVTAATTYCLP